MGADHGHGPHRPSSPAVVRATLAVILPLAIATLTALVWLWPTAPEPAEPEAAGSQRLTGTITQITLKPCGERSAGQGEPNGAPLPPDPATCGDATVELPGGDRPGRRITTPLHSGPGSPRFAPGDAVVLFYTSGQPPELSPYRLSDHDRSTPLWLAGAAFALAVIASGRWRGLMALAGLGITFALLLLFIIPAILAGESPLLTAIVGAAAIMLVVLYLTHGFTVGTSIAIVGTLASLTLTGVLASVAIDLAQLNGITDEGSFYLDTQFQINTRGLLLAGIIIGTLGVLDDVTVTQAVTVAELAHANPAYGFAELYRAAARIGRAHIASVINTIVLAYAGASLPLLLLISIGRQPIGEVLTNPVLAQEIARSVVGTLGLIAAVPITTALAALARARRPGSRHDHGQGQGQGQGHAGPRARHRRTGATW